MVETAAPSPRPFRTVLAQNAWNVVSSEDFAELAAPYPPRMRARMRARRALARWNIRHADRIVCLTETMTELCSRVTTRPVICEPAWAPMDLTAARRVSDPVDQTFGPGVVLVPGTVSWFKRPQLVLPLVRELTASTHDDGRKEVRALFMGHDDGSGAWQHVKHEAARLNVMVERRVVMERGAVFDLMSRAEMVVVPSALESLSFCLSEALALSRAVLASDLPAHREVARRMGREPRWMNDGTEKAVASTDPAIVGAELRAAWVRVGETLGLDRDVSARDGTR